MTTKDERKVKLERNVDYIVLQTPEHTNYGLISGNSHKIPKDWVVAGEYCTDLHTNNHKPVYCHPEMVNRVKEEILLPQSKAKKEYSNNYPIWM